VGVPMELAMETATSERERSSVAELLRLIDGKAALLPETPIVELVAMIDRRQHLKSVSQAEPATSLVSACRTSS
jgi:hypothetical protein